MSFHLISEKTGLKRLFSQLDKDSQKTVFRKIERFRNLFKIASPDEAIYRELMRSMGYSKNKLQFLQLAHMAPYSKLIQLPTRELILKMLLHKAGFSDYTAEITSYFDPTQRLSKDSWVYHRVRPANHPKERIQGISALIFTTKPEGLIKYFDKVLTQSNNLKTFYKSISSATANKIGQSRCHSLLVNVILPTLNALNLDFE